MAYSPTMTPIAPPDAACRETVLTSWVAGSNRIEGITRPPTDLEVNAHAEFLSLPAEPPALMAGLCEFVCRVVGARLRAEPGMDVYVGAHTPPFGGPNIRRELEDLIGALVSSLPDGSGQTVLTTGSLSPFQIHCRYETLHPFMDCNGRSGRVLWAWQEQYLGRDPFRLPFLHAWYYQSLDQSLDEARV